MPVAFRVWSSWLRLCAASLALFALVGIGQLLPAFHFALVAHTLCPEHGELLHESAAPVRTAFPGVPSALAGSGGAHEHEHCGVLALPGTFASPAAAAPGCELAPAPSLVAIPGRWRAAHVHTALLSYAPKLPPPALA